MRISDWSSDVCSSDLMMCSTYGRNPRLLPVSRTEEVTVPQKYARVEGGDGGHYAQWVNACIAGYGKHELSSPFVEYAGPLTECDIGRASCREGVCRSVEI